MYASTAIINHGDECRSKCHAGGQRVYNVHGLCEHALNEKISSKQWV